MRNIVSSLLVLAIGAVRADYVETSRTLTRDETIAVYGRLRVPDAVRIDLAGQALTYTYVTALEGAGEITDSSTGAPGTLTLALEDDATEAMKLSGNLRLVKAGEGELKAADCQSYTGGTIISNGILTVASMKYSLNTKEFRPFGATPSRLTIAPRGKLYPHGLTSWPGHYDIELAGGEIVNSLKTDAQKKFDAAVTLTADSRLSAVRNEKNELAPAGFAGAIALGGHTLLVKVESPVYLTGTISNGTLVTYGTCTNHIPARLDLRTVVFRSHAPLEGEENLLRARPFTILIR